jgi:CBS domain-containing protein
MPRSALGIADKVSCMAAYSTESTERVSDVMLTRPKTLPGDATVAEVRALFANPKVVAALLVDGTAFAGVLDREDLPDAAADDEPARRYARTDVAKVDPGTPVPEARAWLDEHAERRLVVMDADGITLRGLLCLNRRRTGFCSD